MVLSRSQFYAGRYGVACGAVCAAAAEKFAIPVITGMYEENPGADLYRKQAYIVRTGDSAAKMRTAIPAMSKLALKIARGEELGTPADEGYLEQGLRFNTMHHTERGSSRAVAMLLKKLKGEPYQSEYPMPSFSRVTPRPAIKDLKNAKIALVTSGGIVPKGNPDRIEASSASHFGRYDITGIEDLTEDTFETAHGGYDPVYANLDADRVLPIDVLRQMEKEGVIGSLHNVYYATVGNGTSVANAQKYALSLIHILANQARIKETAEKYGRENVVVIIGGAEAEAAGLTAETVIAGDPTYAGPLTNIALDLSIYHILELKELIDPQVYEDQISMMEMVLEVDEIIAEMNNIRDELRQEA